MVPDAGALPVVNLPGGMTLTLLTPALAELRALKPLQNMALLQRGSRLSVQPVSAREFETIMKAAKE